MNSTAKRYQYLQTFGYFLNTVLNRLSEAFKRLVLLSLVYWFFLKRQI